ncbi:hypothetical protein F511_17811 [Dorcoceras hygrometricum]|uniref:Uncharacterized protein n=1 Tax=Dorcoceras hygrometricum TaxID=472368 RepID=A0A2Z7AQI4_9LAMI|nr:hypothetical protein F511_17811 [Dorcoceras hygrometricum]
MVKRLEISPHDPLGIIDSVCKNQSVMVSTQYGPFNTYIPIRSTTIGSRTSFLPPPMLNKLSLISMRKLRNQYLCDPQWFRDTASHSIGYPCTKASGESSTTKHRILHASGPHPIPPPDEPNSVGKRVKVRHLSCRVSMTFRVVRANLYNQDLRLNPLDKW